MLSARSLSGELAEATDGGANGGAVGGVEGVGATGDGLGAGLATPDADSLTLEGELTAEGAEVAGVLGDFELLGALTGVSSVTGTVTSHDTHLDSALSHC